MCRSHFLSGGGIIYALLMNKIVGFLWIALFWSILIQKISHFNEHYSGLFLFKFRMNNFKWKAASFLDPSKQFLIASPSVVPSVKNWWVIQDLQLRWCSTMHFAALRFNYALCSIEVQLCTLQCWGSTMHFAILRFNYALCSVEVQLCTLQYYWGSTVHFTLLRYRRPAV